MEFVFGTCADREILKIKSEQGTNLTGFQQAVIETDVDSTTHNYHIVRKYDQKTGIDGMVYDFYEIDRHNTTVDRTKRLTAQQAQDRADIDFIAMETGVELG